MPSPIVVFSDVDGVLRHHDMHAWTEAARAIRRLEREDIPLVLCSSHTRAEIEWIQQELGIHHPFICESGSAAFIPSGYFKLHVPRARDVAGYQAVEFGRSYAEVVRTLNRIAERLRIDIVGFSDMSVEEVARHCDLSLLKARLAKLREYGERFRVLDPRERTGGRLFSALKRAGLRWIPGEPFDHVGASVDTIVAVNLLRTLYQRARGPVVTLGLADEGADDTLLHVVDRRVMVPGDDPAEGGVDVADWAEAIFEIVAELRGHKPASTT